MIILGSGSDSEYVLLQKLQLVEGPFYKKVLWIDGFGGLNRYFVNKFRNGYLEYEEFESNEVVFSAFHSEKKGIEKAISTGFRIFY